MAASHFGAFFLPNPKQWACMCGGMMLVGAFTHAKHWSLPPNRCLTWPWGAD